MLQHCKLAWKHADTTVTCGLELKVTFSLAVAWSQIFVLVVSARQAGEQLQWQAQKIFVYDQKERHMHMNATRAKFRAHTSRQFKGCLDIEQHNMPVGIYSSETLC